MVVNSMYRLMSVIDEKLCKFETQEALLKRPLFDKLYVQFRVEFLLSNYSQEIGGDASKNNTSIYLKNRAEVCRCAQLSKYNGSLGKYLPKINNLAAYSLQKEKDFCYLSLWRKWIYTKEVAVNFRGYECKDGVVELFSGGCRSERGRFSLDSDCALVYYDLETGAMWSLRKRVKERERKREILELWQSSLELEIY